MKNNLCTWVINTLKQYGRWGIITFIFNFIYLFYLLCYLLLYFIFFSYF